MIYTYVSMHIHTYVLKKKYGLKQRLTCNMKEKRGRNCCVSPDKNEYT